MATRVKLVIVLLTLVYCIAPPGVVNGAANGAIRPGAAVDLPVTTSVVRPPDGGRTDVVHGDKALPQVLTQLCTAQSVKLLADGTGSVLLKSPRREMELTATNWLVRYLTGCAAPPLASVGLWGASVRWIEQGVVPSETLAASVGQEIAQAEAQGWSLPDAALGGLPNDGAGACFTIVLWDGEPARDTTPDLAWLSSYQAQLASALHSLLQAGNNIYFLILRPDAEVTDEAPYTPLWSELEAEGFATVLHARDGQSLAAHLGDAVRATTTVSPSAPPSPMTTPPALDGKKEDDGDGNVVGYVILIATPLLLGGFVFLFAVIHLRQPRLFGWLIGAEAAPVDLSVFVGRVTLGNGGEVHLEGDGIERRHAEIRAARVDDDDVLILRPMKGPVAVWRKAHRFPVLFELVLRDRDTVELGGLNLAFRLIQTRQKKGVRA
jgi:hypothetical protein